MGYAPRHSPPQPDRDPATSAAPALGTMGECSVKNSPISWTDHSFSAWLGCTCVSDGCFRCYAKREDADHYKRVQWGNHPRVRTSDPYWREPFEWDAEAKRLGVRQTVFCNQRSDFFDNQAPPEWRTDAWRVIHYCRNLIFIILTKRPQNIREMLPADWGEHGYENVWIGVSVENQTEAARRIPILLNIPSVKRLLSCEPLLAALDLTEWLKTGLIAWCIVGGESGPGFRPMELDWARNIRDQCSTHNVAFFMKQIAYIHPDRFDLVPNDLQIRQIPEAPPAMSGEPEPPSKPPEPKSDAEIARRINAAQEKIAHGKKTAKHGNQIELESKLDIAIEIREGAVERGKEGKEMTEWVRDLPLETVISERESYYYYNLGRREYVQKVLQRCEAEQRWPTEMRRVWDWVRQECLGEVKPKATNRKTQTANDEALTEVTKQRDDAEGKLKLATIEINTLSQSIKDKDRRTREIEADAEEQIRALKAERDAEKAQANAERARADAEKARADALELELAELRAKLQPDPPEPPPSVSAASPPWVIILPDQSGLPPEPFRLLTYQPRPDNELKRLQHEQLQAELRRARRSLSARFRARQSEHSEPVHPSRPATEEAQHAMLERIRAHTVKDKQPKSQAPESSPAPEPEP
jgi:protein gp37